jgi:hypothetical protein
MRVSSVAAAVALVLSISGSAFAQEYVEYVSKLDRFTVTFPVEPKVTDIIYRSQFNADLPARLYTGNTATSQFSVTVVDFNDIEAIHKERVKSCPVGAETCIGGGSSTGVGYWKPDIEGAVIYATWQIMQRDVKITYLAWNNINLVEGHMLYFTNNKDQSRTSAAIYMHENKLYILEGTVPKGYPDPGFFQQSIGWIDANGNNIRYTALYHNGFPTPPMAGRGGQGAGPGAGGGAGGGNGAPAGPR